MVGGEGEGEGEGELAPPPLVAVAGRPEGDVVRVAEGVRVPATPLLLLVAVRDGEEEVERLGVPLGLALALPPPPTACALALPAPLAESLEEALTRAELEKLTEPDTVAVKLALAVYLLEREGVLVPLREARAGDGVEALDALPTPRATFPAEGVEPAVPLGAALPVAVPAREVEGEGVPLPLTAGVGEGKGVGVEPLFHTSLPPLVVGEGRVLSVLLPEVVGEAETVALLLALAAPAGGEGEGEAEG